MKVEVKWLMWWSGIDSVPLNLDLYAHWEFVKFRMAQSRGSAGQILA